MSGSGSEIYLEIRQIGNIAKITAIHAESGLEVSVSGPAGKGVESLKKTAIAKLKYMLAKEK